MDQRSRSSAVYVWIKVDDVNDQVPVFVYPNSTESKVNSLSDIFQFSLGFKCRTYSNVYRAYLDNTDKLAL